METEQNAENVPPGVAGTLAGIEQMKARIEAEQSAEYIATEMTVGKLRELLAEYPDDLPVILQKDAEGNGYSPLEGGDEAMYVAETTWYGEVYMTDAQVDADPRYTDEDRPPENAIKVLVLWPTN